MKQAGLASRSRDVCHHAMVPMLRGVPRLVYRSTIVFMKFLICHFGACGEQRRCPGGTALVSVCDPASVPAGSGSAPGAACSWPRNWPGLPQGSQRSPCAGREAWDRIGSGDSGSSNVRQNWQLCPGGKQGPWAVPGTVGGQPVHSLPKGASPCSFFTLITCGSGMGQGPLLLGQQLCQEVITR